MLRRALATAAALALAAGPGALACNGKREPPAGQEQPAQPARPAQPPGATPGTAPAQRAAASSGAPGAPAASGTIDAHVHLTTGADGELVAMLDELGVERAVVLASPHLDIEQTPASLSEYRAANEMVLAAAAAHPGRLIPFVTVELGNVEPEYVGGVLDRGACGVKIYQGHRALRWRVQIQANLDFLRAERFRFWRRAEDGTAVTLQDYRGLALATGDDRDQRLLADTVHGNAERWLAPCLARAGRAR